MQLPKLDFSFTPKNWFLISQMQAHKARVLKVKDITDVLMLSWIQNVQLRLEKSRYSQKTTNVRLRFSIEECLALAHYPDNDPFTDEWVQAVQQYLQSEIDKHFRNLEIAHKTYEVPA